MRNIHWFLFWFFYVPLMRLLVLVFFWHPKVSSRLKFEKKNKFEWLSHSFTEISEKADICFEFSSEGEFQQVAPLIEDALEMRKKIELVFFSPSVEKTIMKLAASYPNQIRYLRYPFLRIFPFIQRRSFTHWVTATNLVLVRYDLFPEFLIWGMEKSNSLKIVWCTFKKERMRGKEISFWKKLFLKNSDSIIYAGQEDLELGLKLGFPGATFDFRAEQIKRRLDKKIDKMTQHFSIYSNLKLILEKNDNKIIFGNVWPSDLFLLRDIPKNVAIVVVPHQLSEDILNVFREKLVKMRENIFEINDSSENLELANTYLVNKKGILCELYSDFRFAYVGGGFEGSIHSVLEPLVAGCCKISCGPLHYRSTEFDMANSLKKVSEVNSPEDFYKWFVDQTQLSNEHKITSLLQGYKEMREIIISC